MVHENVPRTPAAWLPGARRLGAALLTVFMPKGCLIRTAQICGSFIIINGTISVMTEHKPANAKGYHRDTTVNRGDCYSAAKTAAAVSYRGVCATVIV
eukprot:21245-Heterococcus_DN1.PRE.1